MIRLNKIARAIRSGSSYGLLGAIGVGIALPVAAQDISPDALDHANQLEFTSPEAPPRLELAQLQLAQNDVAALGRSARGPLEEVVVTARRRDENAQDVPIALSVVSSNALEASAGYTLTDVQRLAPSLQIYSTNPRNTNINIRGLGANIAYANDGLENGVGVYVDNVYYGRPGQSQFDLIDLQQIEVLRGPQGTLFGKNTTGGAVNITTKAPAFEQEGTVELSAGELGFTQVRASLAGPLVEDLLAYRVTVGHTERDGLVENLYDGGDANAYRNLTTRGQLLATPGNNLEIRLIGDYSRQDSNGMAQAVVSTFDRYDNGALIANNFNARIAHAGYTVPYGDAFQRKVDFNGEFQADMESYGLSGQVDWDLDSATLTSITAYRWWDWAPKNDIDYLGVDAFPVAQVENHQRQFSQEFRIASNGNDNVDYVAGIYYLWQRNDGTTETQYGSDAPGWFIPAVAPIVGEAAIANFTSSSKTVPEFASYAAFGQLVWHLTDNLELTTGLRYTYENKEGSFDAWHVRGNDLSHLSPIQQATALAVRRSFSTPTSYTTDFTDDAFSGLISLSYRLGEDVLLYGSYSRGAKSGGMNLTTLPEGIEPEVEAEDVDSFELGVKSEWLDSRLIVNGALFHTTVDNYQTSINEIRQDNGAPRQYLGNAAKARSQGAELESQFEINDNFALTAAISYTDATYVDYKGAPQKFEDLHLGTIQDLSGEKLAGVPELTWNLGFETFHPLTGVAEGLDLYSNVNYAYRDEISTNITNTRYGYIDDYGLLNARIGIRNAAETWDLSLWARNLTDEDYFSALQPNNYGLVTGAVAEPRLIGASVRVNF